jgi:flagellar biosynthetic protein FliO
VGKFNKITYCLLSIFLCFCINICSATTTQPVKTQPQAQTVTAPAPTTAPVADPTEEIGNKTISEVREEYKQDKEVTSPVSVMANLITLLLIMFGLAFAYKKYGKNALDKVLANQPIRRNDIKILSTAPIGQNKFLHIVEVDGERVLIGSTNNNISLLKELKEITEEKAVFNE